MESEDWKEKLEREREREKRWRLCLQCHLVAIYIFKSWDPWAPLSSMLLCFLSCYFSSFPYFICIVMQLVEFLLIFNPISPKPLWGQMGQIATDMKASLSAVPGLLLGRIPLISSSTCFHQPSCVRIRPLPIGGHPGTENTGWEIKEEIEREQAGRGTIPREQQEKTDGGTVRRW